MADTDIEIQVSADLAQELARGIVPPALRSALRGEAVQPRPSYGVGELPEWWFVTMADPTDALHVAQALTRVPGILAAFVKPPAEPP